MGLPWVRLDVNIPHHDKILNLLSDPSPKRYQAALSYVFSFAWSGGTGTDGAIPATALPMIHATTATARLLVKYRLWDEKGSGYTIRNFDSRQELNVIAESKRAGRRASALKANCIRHHGPKCGCWKADLDATA